MIYKTCKNSYLKKTDDLDFQRIGVDDFKHCPDLSIDYAVMEKTKLGTVIKLDSGWSDIGSWDALWKMKEKDLYGIVKEENVLHTIQKIHFCIANTIIVGLGIKNLLVIETNDAILVADKSKSQDVKKLFLY